MDITDDVIAIVLIVLFGIFLELLPACISHPIGFVVAASGPLALTWKHKKLRDKYKKDKYEND